MQFSFKLVGSGRFSEIQKFKNLVRFYVPSGDRKLYANFEYEIGRQQIFDFHQLLIIKKYYFRSAN